MHVMLMSGGADGNLLVLNYGWAFIQNPFVPKKLVGHRCVALPRPVAARGPGIRQPG
jgi:hypothetical protein